MALASSRALGRREGGQSPAKRGAVALLIALTAIAIGAPGASATEIVGRDARDPVLRVDASGRAGVSYRTKAGTLRQVLAFGAVDAYDPSVGERQVRFTVDYTGGQRLFGSNLVATMKNTCTPVAPPLPWLVAACRARDGSFWALQSWQRMLPNLGHDPWAPRQSVRELHLSHWTGPVAQLEVYFDWAYSARVRHLFGRLTYRGKPVFGYSTTASGSPLDAWGRNIYLDTLDSAYGPGWRRENSFLAHTGTGVFCYGFFARDPYPGYPAGRRPPGHGTRYRMTVLGPGVTPAVGWEGPGVAAYDGADPAQAERERQLNSIRRSWNDRLCSKD